MKMKNPARKPRSFSCRFRCFSFAAQKDDKRRAAISADRNAVTEVEDSQGLWGEAAFCS